MNPDSLHAAIMNIGCLPTLLSDDNRRAYQLGHRDARHAAAELVAAAAPQGAQPAEPQALAGPLEQPQEPKSDKANLAQASGVCDLQTARPASHDVTTCPYFGMYLDLSEASGYPHEKDTMVSPEEYGAALLKDAKRYRWLRDGCADTCIGVYNRPWSNDRHWLCANELDAAVDSAIAACEAKDAP